jgi:hypothetical protein
MAKLQQAMQDSLRIDISQDELWAMLGGMYDLEALDERVSFALLHVPLPV